MESLYVPDGDGFVATELTRGPWRDDHQHGGPPAALMAGELERRVAEESGGVGFHPARLTVELVRPVPIARLRVATETVRAGRTVREVAATCSAGGEVVARATLLVIRRAEIGVEVSHGAPAPRALAESESYRFGFFTAPVGYHTAIEMRVAEGEWGGGRMAVWLRLRVPVVPGEEPSPLQRVMVAADSGNGISAALDPARFSFVNPDLAVYLHRVPEGEWICLAATTDIDPGGVGLADCALADQRGPIGRSLQTLVIAPR